MPGTIISNPIEINTGVRGPLPGAAEFILLFGLSHNFTVFECLVFSCLNQSSYSPSCNIYDGYRMYSLSLSKSLYRPWAPMGNPRNLARLSGEGWKSYTKSTSLDMAMTQTSIDRSWVD